VSAGEARIIGVMGSTGSGKSAWIKRHILKPKPARLLIWDFKREYGAFAKQTDNLGEVLTQVSKPKFAAAFMPAMDDKLRARQFDMVCRAALAAQNLTLLVEELAFVTRPGWAPSAWRMLTLTGRHDGMVIVGASQRPASIDKDFLGNCTLVHSGVLGYEDDAKFVAKVLRVPTADLMTLPPLHWIERDRGAGEPRRGVLTFRGAK
jgi:hypothetical protein